MYGSGAPADYLELACEHPLRVAVAENCGSFRMVLTLSAKGLERRTTRECDKCKGSFHVQALLV
jgi:transcriptional antiterminator Rof (Rho-off)